ITDMARLEKRLIARMPERPTPELLHADDGAAKMANIIKRHVEFGHAPRVLAHRQEWIDAINATQHPDGTWPYNPDYMRDIRMIGHVAAGLWHLGGQPAHRIRLVERLQRPAALD